MSAGGQVLAVSTDGPDTAEKFRQHLGAEFPLIPDPKATLALQYGAKLPFIPFARRVTFVIGREGRIQRVDDGSDALDANIAIAACVFPAPSSES